MVAIMEEELTRRYRLWSLIISLVFLILTLSELENNNTRYNQNLGIKFPHTESVEGKIKVYILSIEAGGEYYRYPWA